MPLTTATCTVYNSPSDLWLQIREENGRQLKLLMLDLKRLATDAELRRQAVGREYSVGERVLAQGEQKLWFRGQLLQRQSANIWEVQLVDFAWQTLVSSEQLLPMPDNLDGVSDFAIRCRLAGLRCPPSGWSLLDCQLLQKRIVSPDVDLSLAVDFFWREAAAGEPLPVEIFVNNRSVNEEFGAETGTLMYSQPPPPTPSQPPKSAVEPAAFTPQAVESRDPVEGRVSHVTDAGIVFVQSNEKQLRDLQSQLVFLEECDNLESFSASTLPLKDEIFAVFQDKRHYRGRMLQNNGEQARLLIVDFGFELTVDWSRCARIPKRIRYEPQCQAFEMDAAVKYVNEVSLEDCWNSLESDEAVRVVVTPLVNQQPKEVPTASVTLASSGQELAEFLVQQRGAQTPSVSYRQDASLNWDVDNIVSAVCVSVGATGDVFFREKDDTNYERLQTIFAKLLDVDSLDRAPELHAGLSVLACKSGRLERATVKSVNEESRQCELLLVDTGEEVQAESDSLRTVPQEVLTVPLSLVRCRLANGAKAVGVGDVCTLSVRDRQQGSHVVEILRSNAAA